MPYITPSSIPAAAICRRLRIPSDPLCLAAVSGALSELILPINWEQVTPTSLSADQAAALMTPMYDEYVQSISCYAGEDEPPFWEDAEGDDLTGDADLNNEPDYPWYDQLSDWVIAGFLATTFTPGAGVAYLTYVPKARIAFRKRNLGALFRILINGLEVTTGSLEAPSNEIEEVDVDIAGFAAANSLGAPPYTLRIEHAGAPTEDDQPRSLEIVRKRLQPPTLADVYPESAPTFEEIAQDYEDVFGEALLALEFRVDDCQLQYRLSSSSQWVNVTGGDLSQCTVAGADGASAEMRVSDGFIQWRQDDDDPTWANLVDLDDLRGADGQDGADGAQGPQGEQGPPGADGEDCDTCPPSTGAPPDPPAGDDLACNVAQGLGELVYNWCKDLIADLQAAATITAGVLDFIARLPGVDDIGVDAAISAVNSAISSGLALVNSAIDTPFKEQALQCGLYCVIPSDGVITQQVLDDWKGKIAEYGGNGAVFTQLLIDSFSLETYRRRAVIYSQQSANCDLCDCDDTWCYTFDFTQSDGGWAAATGYASIYSSGSGWSRSGSTGGIVAISRTFTASILTSMEVELDEPMSGNLQAYFYGFTDGDIYNAQSTQGSFGSGTSVTIDLPDGTRDILEFAIQAGSPNGSYPYLGHIVRITMRGTGANPFGEDNC